MLSEIVTSVGSIGPEFNRSEGRAYFTVGERITNAADLIDLSREFGEQAFSMGRRRWVVRAQCAPRS